MLTLSLLLTDIDQLHKLSASQRKRRNRFLICSNTLTITIYQFQYLYYKYFNDSQLQANANVEFNSIPQFLNIYSVNFIAIFI